MRDRALIFGGRVMDTLFIAGLTVVLPMWMEATPYIQGAANMIGFIGFAAIWGTKAELKWRFNLPHNSYNW